MLKWLQGYYKIVYSNQKCMQQEEGAIFENIKY